jgi:hypothetical protein
VDRTDRAEAGRLGHGHVGLFGTGRQVRLDRPVHADGGVEVEAVDCGALGAHEGLDHGGPVSRDLGRAEIPVARVVGLVRMAQPRREVVVHVGRSGIGRGAGPRVRVRARCVRSAPVGRGGVQIGGRVTGRAGVTGRRVGAVAVVTRGDGRQQHDRADQAVEGYVLHAATLHGDPWHDTLRRPYWQVNGKYSSRKPSTPVRANTAP